MEISTWQTKIVLKLCINTETVPAIEQSPALFEYKMSINTSYNAKFYTVKKAELPPSNSKLRFNQSSQIKVYRVIPKP